MSNNLQRKKRIVLLFKFHLFAMGYAINLLGGGGEGLMQQPEIDLYLFLIIYKVRLYLFFII